MSARLPRIALTTGEPAGIGPDLALTIAQSAWACELVICGDADLLRARAKQLRLSLQFKPYVNSERTPHQPGIVRYASVPLSAPVQPGQLNFLNAGYVISLLNLACDGCQSGEFDAMVTAPVQKSIINAAGIAFSGHTEYLAERLHAPLPVMMLVAGSLRVALVTTHLALSEVPAAITPERLLQTIAILHHDLQHHFGMAQPRIMVLGLNPHAGEAGYLGREELEVINPVLDSFRAAGMNITAALPADTAFTSERLAQCDAVLAMYHDQGLPVLKYVGFGNAVNVTLGLPIIRTSVDHGTALDLAGTGKADAGSLAAALRLALTLAEHKSS